MPDPIKKYKAPNGKIVAETELKDKYGDRFSDLVSKGTFSEVNEPIYKTPNGSYEVESVLKNKYGDKFNTLIENNTFSLDTPLKKKESSESTSQNQELVSETSVPDGSVGTSQNSYDDYLDELNKGIESSISNNKQEIERNVNAINELYQFEDSNKNNLQEAEQRAKSSLNYLEDQPEEVVNAYNEFSAANELTDDELSEIDAQIKEEKSGDFGVLSNWWNNVKSSHLGMDDNRKVSNRDDLIAQKKEQKRIDYLNKIDDPELRKKVADLKLSERFRSNQKIKDAELLIQQKGLEANALVEKIYRLEDNQKRINDALEAESDPEIREQLIQEGVANEDLYKQHISDIQLRQSEAEDLLIGIEENVESIGTFNDELNLLKRNYQWLENQKETLKLGVADVANSIKYQAESFTNNIVNGPNITNNQTDNTLEGKKTITEESLKFRQETSRQREFLEPKLQVKDVENVSDAVEFTINSTIENIPTLAQFSMGGVGVASFALSQQASEELDIRQGIIDDKKRLIEIEDILNDKSKSANYNALELSKLEKEKENLVGKRKLTELDIVATSSAFAGVEIALGYIGRIRLVNKGKRVIKSIGKNELKTQAERQIAKTIGKEVFDFAKDATGEGLEEIGSGIFKDIVEIGYFNDKLDANGDNRNVGDNAFENFAGGFAVGANISATTKVIGNTAGMIANKKRRNKVAENTVTALKLLEKAQLEGLPLDTKNAFNKKADELLKENADIINKTQEEWKGLNEEEKARIKAINSETQGINITLEKIKSESNGDTDIVPVLESRLRDIETEKESILEKKKTNEAKETSTTEETKKGTQPEMEVAASSTEVKQESTESTEEVETTEFKSWFGDWKNNPEQSSKVVDEKGKPLLVYHGGEKGITSFKSKGDEGYVNNDPHTQNGIYFTRNIRNAEVYTYRAKNPAIYQVYIDIKNPYDETKLENYEKDGVARITDNDVKKMKKGGYDGIISDEIVALNSNQIKIIPKNKQNTSESKPTQENETTNQVTNEAQTEGNTTTNEDVQPRVEPSVQQGESNSTQSTVEPGASDAKTEVKTLSETQQKQNSLVDAKNKFNKLSKSKKNSTEGTSLKTSINELSKDLGFTVSEKRGKLSVTNKKGKEAGKISFKEQLPKAKKEDINHATKEVQNGILDWDGNPFSRRVDLGLTRADIKKGQADIKAGKTNTVPAKRVIQALKEAKEKGVYEYIEGSGGKINRIEVPLTEVLDDNTIISAKDLEEINQNENQLSNEYDNWINSLDDNTLNEIYENETGESGLAQEKPIEEGESQENVSNKKEAKPTKAERKELAKAKVDDIANAIKDIDSIFGIKIKIDDVDGLNKNGINIVDMIASIAKQAIDAGIEIDEAIQKTIAHLKTKFDFDVDINEVKKKLQPKSANTNFKRKPGQKSILTRAATGGARTEVTDALKKHGLDYEVKNQEEAKEKAQAFVKSIGLLKAVDFLKSGTLEISDTLAFIYGEVIDQLEAQSMASKNQKEANDYTELQNEMIKALDETARSQGQFISALSKVLTSSHFKYNLNKQIEAYKARNNGEIDAETLKKFEERDARIKQYEKEIQDLQEKLAKAEANEAIEDINEFNERSGKKRKKPTKSQLKKAANALRKAKFTQSINDLAKLQSDPAGVIKAVWDGAIETVATVLNKTGDIEIAVKEGIKHIKKSDWYKGLNSKNKKIVENKLKEDAETIYDDSITEDDFEVTVDDEGKIKIPAKLIRQYVSDGIKDADELAQKIIDDHLSQTYPDQDFTIRQVRDAITGYGKTVNPKIDALGEEISKLKNLGRVTSGMEDVEGGSAPKKSGYQRRKKTPIELRAEKELKRLMVDLGVNEQETDSQWKTRLQTAKSRVQNQIDELNDQIAKGERRRVERTPMKQDQELKDLIEIRDALKKELDSKVGKPQLTPEQRARQIENALETQIKKIDTKLKTGDYSFAKKKKTVTSPRIEALRAQKKKLADELTEMRKQSGLIAANQLQNRKNAIDKRLAELKEKRKNKDYSKRKRKPLPEDAELKQKQIEYRREKEKYDQEAYQDELRNLKPYQKWARRSASLLGIPRNIMTTGEFSFIMLQNAVPTINLLLKNPRKLSEIFKKTRLSYSRKNFEKDFGLLEEHPLYDLALESKVSFTRTDYKESAKNEEFQGDAIHALFKLAGAEKVNPFALMERLTTTYSNEVKMALFEKGVKQLEANNKNITDNKTDYKRLANAINTLTGRANLGSKMESNNHLWNMLFFSMRFAVSTANKTVNLPFYYASLRDSESSALKPSVAQKLLISQTATYVVAMGAFVVALQALGGDDEEGNPNITIETDPTSSDFMKLKSGNTRIDVFGGHLPWLVLMSRLFTGDMKKSNGKTIALGQGSNPTRFDVSLDFVLGKLNPTIAIPTRVWKSGAEIDGTRYDKYGNEVSLSSELSKLYPIYWQGLVEYSKENKPKARALTNTLIGLGLIGVNNQVYGSTEAHYLKTFTKDTKNEISVLKQELLKPSKDTVITQEEMIERFEIYKKKNEENYKKLQKRIAQAYENGLDENDIRLALSSEVGGLSKTDLVNVLRYKVPAKLSPVREYDFAKKVKNLYLATDKTNETKRKEGENKFKDMLKKKNYYNFLVEQYNNELEARKFNQ